MTARKRLLTAAVLVSAVATPASAVPKKRPVAAASTGQGGSTGVTGLNGAFLLDRLPAGKSVTIPRPATTLVPLSSRVMLTATDLPQSVSFKSVRPGGGLVSRVRIGIYDGNADRVKYVEINPGTPFLYNMKDLETITIVPDGNGRDGHYLALRVESDKPLEIAH
jgi:hypothetical protein